jgi:peptide/nickel transport system substrate-binding protein
MSMDRDAFIDVLYDVDKFTAAGLPVEKRYCSAVSPVFPEWLNPQGKDFGPNAKYYTFDIPEAKKLMAAAGFPNGLRVNSYWTNTGYGDLHRRKVEVLEGLVQAAGFEFNDINPTYPAEWNNTIRDVRGNFEGIAHRNWAGTQPDATTRAVFEFTSTPGNILYTGFDPDGKGDFSGDKTLEDMVLRAQREFDAEKRKAIMWEVQRYAAKKQYNVRNPGGANTFLLAWPALKNFNVYQGASTLLNSYEWIDDTLPPVKKT